MSKKAELKSHDMLIGSLRNHDVDEEDDGCAENEDLRPKTL